MTQQPRAVVTSEAPAAPILLSLYANDGLAGGRVELSPVAAVQLALDLLLACAAPNLTAERLTDDAPAAST